MKINIHIVAPYEAMIPVIQECIPLFPALDITYSLGDLEVGVRKAVDAEEKGADILISRGGTAQFIKKNVRIPVLDMHLSGYDMIRSLSLATNLERKTAIVGFSNITSGAQAVIDLLDLPLQVFTISDLSEVAPLILELKNTGYEQIVGDVITLKTSKAYGLKGFLIQSGKESIMNSLEDAEILYRYLQDNNNVTKVMEQYIVNNHQNLMMIDGQNKLIYEHWTDFPSNPLTKEHLYILNTDLEINQHKVTRNLMLDDRMINVTGTCVQVEGQRYKVIVIDKNTMPLMERRGLTIETEIASEPIADTSVSIKTILNHIETLYKSNQIILLEGRKGTSKAFITQYIHQKLADGGMLATLNFKEFDQDYLDQLPLGKIRTIKLLNTEFADGRERLSHFLKECQKQQVRIFIVSENGFVPELLPGLKLTKIMMPTLSERKEDIRTLAQYFIAYYNQKYGTTAVKITNEAIGFLENYSYPNEIDDLKNLIKQIALNSQDYVIQKETIEKANTNEHLPANDILQKGTLKEIEKEIIKWVLKAENHNQTKAAERLGINRATLWRKLKE
ncbi:PrpR N-terminal domain-containing protein [Bacillus sp. EB106-08-02-XG196]|jgi:transcriptional regulator, propionate catabolism operon regulatory protein|uniref:PrpR N-terminal domain-containing protein n=1 Tax=Bacillus sp. EB106-08-02-XG196 TaxID=2737049 RepID=UPI0015C4C08E|nr:PrpR N-terminal domain-containing protein [Bacillus sp. EB106-08-02-XG196]NWQ41894.1 PrpR N-terminal domain-containing protein [Bacillus sp. EB106-08-02-XG196]